jgi:predicted short-subunit dehydrogenase-like oxidoreductase (DUF2520 family)
VTRIIERTVALVGPGRAGRVVARALADRGARVLAVAGRSPEAESTRVLAAELGARAVTVEDAGRDAELVVIATPDAVIESVAARVAPNLRDGALVIHLSGARGLDALALLATARPDVRIGALHPLQTLTEVSTPAELTGAWAAVAGPTAVTELAQELGLHPFVVDDAHRATYHAAACVASNHLVALLGQAERLAAEAGVPFEALARLVHASVDNACAFGPAAALTGPVARGDLATIAAHLEALPPEERPAYRALAAEALRLAGRTDDALEAMLA